jgi:hypothetical protein
MERRDFVNKLAAGTALLPLLMTEASALRMARSPLPLNSCPSNWQLTLKKMKETGKPVIVVRVSINQEHKALLSGLFNNSSMQEILSTHIFVCLSDQYCKQIFKNHSASNIIIVTKEVKDAKGHKWNLSKDKSAGETIAALRQIVYGKEFDKLKLVQKGLKIDLEKQKEIDAALVQLNADSFKDRRQGRLFLSKNFTLAYPVLIMNRDGNNSVEVRESCKEILRSETRRCKYKILGSQTLQNNSIRFNDTAILCGMASIPAESRNFINQLAG